MPYFHMLIIFRNIHILHACVISDGKLKLKKKSDTFKW